jgi:RNA polymerase sigma-70 factor, ECF subfamily
METTSQGIIDARIHRNIDFHSSLLARDRAVPGMDRDDFAQDLLTDLLGRRKGYNPRLASFRTYAERVVRHRAADLRTPTSRKIAERQLVSLDAPAPGTNESALPLGELLLEENAMDEDQLGMHIDMSRFVSTLPDSLINCCEILLAKSVADGAREAGIARSTAYERLAGLRSRARTAGLLIYVADVPDRFGSAPVCGPNPMVEMRSMFASLPACRDRRDFEAWLESAQASAGIVYFRGYLALDGGADAGSPLGQLARSARDASGQGLVHLVQRRLGPADFAYIAIARVKVEPDDEHSVIAEIVP